MGQYWIPVNLDKKEFIDPHKLGSGMKLWEQLTSSPSVGGALIVLCAAMPEPRGGGDFDIHENWHGSERTFLEHNGAPGPMPESYPKIAAQTIGRWAGDRIALVGDYGKDSDLEVHEGDPPISEICALCEDRRDGWTDVSSLVQKVIEHELQGKYEDGGWKGPS